MKSQDILLLLKLVSLERQQGVPAPGDRGVLGIPDDWRGWTALPPQEDDPPSPVAEDMFSVRALEESTGISKSEVSGSLRRCMDVGLAKPERGSGLPRANTRARLGFIMNGTKFVFPADRQSVVVGKMVYGRVD